MCLCFACLRKSAKKYERELLAEYQRRGRPVDGLTIKQCGLIYAAIQGGQDCFDLDQDENNAWFLSNGQSDKELPDLKKDADYMLMLDGESGRATIRIRGIKRARAEALYADTLLPPVIQDAEFSRGFLKENAVLQPLLPPNYDDLRLQLEPELEAQPDAEALVQTGTPGANALMSALQQQLAKGVAQDMEEQVCDCGLPNAVCGVCGCGYQQRIQVPKMPQRQAAKKPAAKPLRPPSSDDENESELPQTLDAARPSHCFI